ncbi:MAG TPA: hypothetical protein ENI05_04515 [Porticoccus sp.]|nr:hypothetical protein [Porticoccus sp.]
MKIRVFIFLAFVVSMNSSYVLGNPDMDNMIRIMEKNQPEKFEAILKQFISSARSKNIDEMVSLTSRKTIEIMGIDKLRGYYKTEAIPAINMCTAISEGGEVIHISKKESPTGPGWAFRKTCSYNQGKEIVFQFIILNENGRIALTSFGLG